MGVGRAEDVPRWFGGVMALFLFVTALFRQNRTVALNATPIIFVTFERYHLILAAAALVSCGVWMGTAPIKIKTAVFAMLAIAAVVASASAGVITPRIIALRKENRVNTPEFKKMHGLANALYMSEALALLGAGVMIAATAQTRSAEPTAVKE